MNDALSLPANSVQIGTHAAPGSNSTLILSEQSIDVCLDQGACRPQVNFAIGPRDVDKCYGYFAADSPPAKVPSPNLIVLLVDQICAQRIVEVLSEANINIGLDPSSENKLAKYIVVSLHNTDSEDLNRLQYFFCEHLSSGKFQQLSLIELKQLIGPLEVLQTSQPIESQKRNSDDKNGERMDDGEISSSMKTFQTGNTKDHRNSEEHGYHEITDAPLIRDQAQESPPLMDINNNSCTPLFSFDTIQSADEEHLFTTKDHLSASDLNLPFLDAEMGEMNGEGCIQNKEMSNQTEDFEVNKTMKKISAEKENSNATHQGIVAVRNEGRLLLDKTLAADRADQVTKADSFTQRASIASTSMTSHFSQPMSFAGGGGSLNRPESGVCGSTIRKGAGDPPSRSYCVKPKDTLSLDGEVMAIGQYKIDILSLVLSANNIDIRIEKTIMDSGLYKVSSVNTLVLPRYEIIKILSHFGTNSTTAMFIYIAPNLASQVQDFLKNGEMFKDNISTGNANGYNLIVVLLRAMSPGKSVKCQEILTKFGTKENPMLQIIGFETAGEYIKACFHQGPANSEATISNGMAACRSRTVSAVEASAEADAPDVFVTDVERPSKNRPEDTNIRQGTTKATTIMTRSKVQNQKKFRGKIQPEKRRLKAEDVPGKNVIMIN